MSVGRLAVSRSVTLLVLVLLAPACSSSNDDDAARSGETCSRGTTTAACDLCAQTECRAKYRASFHDPQSSLGDTTAPGACLEQGRCIAHCPCGDTACYDLCTPSVACTASIFELRNCEAVRCGTECASALDGVGGACIDLLRCCSSERMAEELRSGCRSLVAEGRVSAPTDGCEARLGSYRRDGYCD
ncbi:MAG: hypothetical protein ABI175_23745 [Polyangiales bacterium]